MKLLCSLLLLCAAFASHVNEPFEHLVFKGDTTPHELHVFAEYLLKQIESPDSVRFCTTKLLNFFQKVVNKHEDNQLAPFADSSFDLKTVRKELLKFPRATLFINDLRRIAADGAKNKYALLAVDIAGLRLLTRQSPQEIIAPVNLYFILSLSNRHDLSKSITLLISKYFESITAYSILPGFFCYMLNILLHLHDEGLRLKHKQLIVPLYKVICDELRFITVRTMLETHHYPELLDTLEDSLNEGTRRQHLQAYNNFRQQRHLRIYAMGMSIFLLDQLLKDGFFPEDMYFLYAIYTNEGFSWSSTDFMKQAGLWRMQAPIKKEIRIYFLAPIKPPISFVRRLQSTLVSGEILKSLRTIKDWDYIAMAFSMSVIELDVSPFDPQDSWSCILF